MAKAHPDDVDPGIISTDLEPLDIQGYIDDAEWEAADANDDYDDWDADDKEQLEKYLAALRIREIRERDATRERVADVSFTYDGPSTAALRKQVDRRDPSGTLAYNRDTDRYVTSTAGD